MPRGISFGGKPATRRPILGNFQPLLENQSTFFLRGIKLGARRGGFASQTSS
jgi:hypothetical protein